MHVKKYSWKLITICCSKSCSLQICCPRKSTFEVVKDLILQRAGEEFKSPHFQPRLLWLLR